MLKIAAQFPISENNVAVTKIPKKMCLELSVRISKLSGRIQSLCSISVVFFELVLNTAQSSAPMVLHGLKCKLYD